MRYIRKYGIFIGGLCAGLVNGLFGAGGGMILIPLLTWLSDLDERELFPSSIAVILPICLTSLSMIAMHTGLDWASALPYLPGSALGGFLAGWFGRKIPVKWLHRSLGVLILWGGVRYLC